MPQLPLSTHNSDIARPQPDEGRMIASQGSPGASSTTIPP